MQKINAATVTNGKMPNAKPIDRSNASGERNANETQMAGTI
jgi:hypothetical protein